MRPAGLRSRYGRQSCDESDGRLEQQRERFLERLGRDVARCARRGAASVPDEDVDAAEGGDGLLHSPLEVARRRDVAADGEPRRSVLPRARAGRAGGRQRDVRALGGERLGAREPEPGRRSGDERRATAQSEVHASALRRQDADDLAHGPRGGLQRRALVVGEVELDDLLDPA